MLNGKSIFITGGTGSFGRKFTETILAKYPDIKRLVIFSRDELKQFDMSNSFPHSKYPSIRYFLGDVRDKDRLKRALNNIDIVVHAAALKQVPAAEYNPMEFVKTNIMGAENLISAAIDCNVKAVVALSTDKAAAPINLYGATKLCSDKLFVTANNISGGHDIKFSVVRYGNVLGSRGSVVPFFLEKRKTGTLPITHEEMTRFNISLDEGVEMVLHAIDNAIGGEIFIPKIASFKLVDLAEAVSPSSKVEIVGIRPGEKLHEEMITSSDSYMTVDLGRYFAILPQSPAKIREYYIEKLKAKSVAPGFSFNSKDNTDWLSVEALRDLIRKHVDPEFKE